MALDSIYGHEMHINVLYPFTGHPREKGPLLCPANLTHKTRKGPLAGLIRVR